MSSAWSIHIGVYQYYNRGDGTQINLDEVSSYMLRLVDTAYADDTSICYVVTDI